MLNMNSRTLVVAGWAILAGAPAMAGGPGMTGGPGMAGGAMGRSQPAAERPATGAQALPAQALPAQALPAQPLSAQTRSTQARSAETDDMQALIAATREMARSTGAAADSIGMDPDRLSGILMRLDRIEARVKRLDHPASHPSPDATAGWR